jgi:hypothetical protein
MNTTDIHPAFWLSRSGEDGFEGVFAGETVALPGDLALWPGDSELRRRIPAGTVIEAKAAQSFLEPARRNLQRWLTSKTVAAWLSAPLRSALAVELCHLQVALFRHASIAAAECEDQELQQILGKLAIHASRCVPHWQEIASSLTGESLDGLLPLPGTGALVLAFEELASRDTLGYCTAAALFGAPGARQTAGNISDLVVMCCPDNPEAQEQVQRWAAEVTSTATSYASVSALAAMGHPYDGDLLAKATELLAPFTDKQILRTTAGLRQLDEHFELMLFGIRHSLEARGEAWPRPRVDWLAR